MNEKEIVEVLERININLSCLNGNLNSIIIQLKSLYNIDKKLYKLNWLIENKVLRIRDGKNK
jgi:hypothetical protein